jgi:hypothetical protein
MNEIELPEEIKSKAHIRSGREYAWKKSDFESAVIAAKSNNLASIGGQAQFIFRDGVCEMYWINYDSTGKKPDESWESFVNRSADEVLSVFRIVVEVTDFRKEALEFNFIKDKIETDEIDPLDYLWFVGYFKSKPAN